MNEQLSVGDIPIPAGAAREVGNMLAILEEKYEFKNGSTAAYWYICAVLAQHLEGGKQ